MCEKASARQDRCIHVRPCEAQEKPTALALKLPHNLQGSICMHMITIYMGIGRSFRLRSVAQKARTRVVPRDTRRVDSPRTSHQARVSAAGVTEKVTSIGMSCGTFQAAGGGVRAWRNAALTWVKTKHLLGR